MYVYNTFNFEEKINLEDSCENVLINGGAFSLIKVVKTSLKRMSSEDSKSPSFIGISTPLA
jgi:hypothetical protein